MDLKSGYPFWQVQSGLLATYDALDADADTEVLVIGGGVTGALVSHALVEAGLDVVVVDRRDIGWGSTSATTALLQYDLDSPLSELAKAIGEDRAARVYRCCRSALDTLAGIVGGLEDRADFERVPSLYLASHPRDVPGLELERTLRCKHGLAVDLWSEDRIADEFPFRRAAALFTPDAAQADPYRLTHSLLRHNARRGLRVYDRTTVRAVSPTSTGVQVETERGPRIQARHVVYATGYETQDWCRLGKVKLRSTYALASEPLGRTELWSRRALLWETARPYMYLRTTADGRIVAGGCDDPFDSADRRDRRLPRKIEEIERQIRRMFPDLAFDIAFSWAGTFAETEDAMPYIGPHPAYPAAQFALCYGGNGIVFAVIAAELIRDAILGRPSADAALFGFER